MAATSANSQRRQEKNESRQTEHLSAGCIARGAVTGGWVGGWVVSYRKVIAHLVGIIYTVQMIEFA